MIQSAIQVLHLKKTYQKKAAVSDVDFSMEQGEILGLLGPNGAGKSTTINILSTILKPDSGEVQIFGNNLKTEKKKIKRLLGVVPQELAIYEEISAEKNVLFFAGLYGLSSDERRKYAKEALELVGLYDRRLEKPKTFSGGMKRRLNIACAIAHRPKLIIMDEPTVGIDPQSRNHILEAIRSLQKQGAAILYSTHYMEEAEQIADRILIMDEGKIIASGTKAELCRQVEDEITYMFTLDKEPEENRISFEWAKGARKVVYGDHMVSVTVDKKNENLGEMVAAILTAGYRLKSMVSREASLEAVFLNLTGKSLRD